MLGVAYDIFAILLADDLQAALVIGRMAGRSGGFHGSSPILLLKNFNQDRGLALFQAIYGTNGGGFNRATPTVTCRQYPLRQQNRSTAPRTTRWTLRPTRFGSVAAQTTCERCITARRTI